MLQRCVKNRRCESSCVTSPLVSLDPVVRGEAKLRDKRSKLPWRLWWRNDIDDTYDDGDDDDDNNDDHNELTMMVINDDNDAMKMMMMVARISFHLCQGWKYLFSIYQWKIANEDNAKLDKMAINVNKMSFATLI